MRSDESVATRVIATGGLMLATLTNALDTTIANVALPHVARSLSAAQDRITWVLTSYTVGTAIEHRRSVRPAAAVDHALGQAEAGRLIEVYAD